MKSLFWTGKLTFPVKLLVNTNSILSWLLGNTRNETRMKERVKLGYDGRFSDHIKRYDELSSYFQKRTAIAQLEGIDCQGKDIIDIGCGTGIIAFLALDSGAIKATCGDISDYMLQRATENARALGYNQNQIKFCQLDAESLPFEDASFDMVLTGMAFGLFPNQEKAVHEMFRVLRPGGLVSIGAHGPEHYWEAIDGTIRALTKKYVLGYRFEFWPRTEKLMHNMLVNAGFKNVRTNRFIWRNLFHTPSEACDFFAAVTSNWWYSEIPEKKRSREYEKTKGHFNKNGIRIVTDDIIAAFGIKT
jgi:ubiquinone/menaquinone biosynthesis C-methylase UbiE